MYIIKNGLIIDPQSGFNQVSDMLIDQGKIKQISKEIDIKGIPIIDASNKIVAPGLVDIHVHFREPGQTHKENIHTGALSAAVGGFTTVLMMANTNPTISSPEIVKQVKESAAKEAIKIETVATITKSLNGKDLVNFEELLEAGVAGFSDDDIPLTDTKVLQEAMNLARKHDVVLSLHEEDPSLNGVLGINEHIAQKIYHVCGASGLAEYSMIARDAMIAYQTQAGTQTDTSKPETPAPSQSVTPVVPSQPQVTATPQKSEVVTPAITSGIDLPDVAIPTAMASAAYVKHWIGNDAYTHNLLSHRYGITAAQLDGFLQSTGITYDSSRIDGQKILDREKSSGLDARAIIAIAIAESSLGTQGVATAPGANMFGFGAVDNNTTNAQNFSDDKAVIKMTQETIIQNQNTSFAIQDQKAQFLSTGNLNVAARGGVYFTDASGSGKRRAAIMESIDKWIDAHGGISEISKELLNTSSVAMMAVPTSYSVSRANQAGNYVAGTYPWGQRTWLPVWTIYG